MAKKSKKAKVDELSAELEAASTSDVTPDKAGKKKDKKKDKKADAKPAKADAKGDNTDAKGGKADAKTGKKRKKKVAEGDVAEEDRALIETVVEQTPAEVVEERLADPEPAPVAPEAVSAKALTELLRVGSDFNLADVDPSSTPGFEGERADAEATMVDTAEELGEWQERLYADGRSGGKRSLLLIVQGMDTSGKGGIMRHVVGTFDPQGVKLTSFKAPTAEERSKGYLWRIRNALPSPGQIGVFDRSQYEDVLIARVRSLVPRSVWARRYAGINAFERQTTAKGITIVKVMLHISNAEQKERLAERITRPDKYWKFNPGDIDERLLWDDYQAAYQDAVTKCSTPDAPWFVVPADHKWYARWAVQQLVLAALREMNPDWPAADFDPVFEAERLADS